MAKEGPEPKGKADIAEDKAEAKKGKGKSNAGLGSVFGLAPAGPGSTGGTGLSGPDDAARLAQEWLEYIGAGVVKQTDPRVHFLVGWMNAEGQLTNGNPWNFLAITSGEGYKHGLLQNNPAGVVTFASKDTGFAALVAYFQNQGMSGFLQQFLTPGTTTADLHQSLINAHWEGSSTAPNSGGPGQTAAQASKNYADKVLGYALTDAYASTIWGGDYAYGYDLTKGTVGKLPTAPKHDTYVTYSNQYNVHVTNPTNVAVESAYSVVANYLQEWGMTQPGLDRWAYQQAHNGLRATEILDELRKTPAYAKVFPGNVQRIKEGLLPLSESQYKTLEDSIFGIAGTAGLPTGFMTRELAGRFIATNVSPSQISERVQAAFSIASRSDQNVRNQFAQYFGVRGSIGAITAYFLDPKRALDIITQEAAAAQYGAWARDAGLGPLTRQNAMALASAKLANTYGYSPTAIRGALQDAGRFTNLSGKAAGSVGQTVNQQELIGSRLLGYDKHGTADAQAVRSAESAKESFLVKGGGFDASPQGIVGVGAASTEGIGHA